MPYFQGTYITEISQEAPTFSHVFLQGGAGAQGSFESPEASDQARFCVGFDCFFFPPFPNEEDGVPAKKLTYHHFEGTFEDDFPFFQGGIC